jgi:hypothetical protein
LPVEQSTMLLKPCCTYLRRVFSIKKWKIGTETERDFQQAEMKEIKIILLFFFWAYFNLKDFILFIVFAI